MKKATKTLLLMLCAVVLVVSSILGTVAYLTDTKTVNNTFTVGKVEIKLYESVLNPETGKAYNKGQDTTETGNTGIKMIPGRVIEKDPTIAVAADSEDCYLFVKIENGVDTTVGTINWGENPKWTHVDGTQLWQYAGKVSKGATVPVFESFTCANGIKEYANGVSGSAITVTAYAIQAEGLEQIDALEQAKALAANAGN